MLKHDNIVPEIFVHDGPGALEFYERAFGATERSRMMSRDGKKLMHGELEIGGHRLVVCDEFTAAEGGTCRCPRTLGGTGVRMILSKWRMRTRSWSMPWRPAATIMIPVADMFWGARYGKLMDPYGHEWGINQQMEQPTDAEKDEGAARYFSNR